MILSLTFAFQVACQFPMDNGTGDGNGTGNEGDVGGDDTGNGGTGDSNTGSGSTDEEEDDDNPSGRPSSGDFETGANYVFKSADLSKYMIIYSSEYVNEYSTYAYDLQSHIKTKYGVSVKGVAMDLVSSAYPYEILIGFTNRDTSDNGKIMQYSVTVGGGKFRINAGGLFTMENVIAYLKTNVFTGSALNITPGEYYKKSYLTTSQVALTSGTTARIMTTNILADEFNTSADYKTASYRAEIYAGLLATYQPDVVGVQETDSKWNAVLNKYLTKIKSEYNIEFTRVLANYNNKVNFTSLIYRSDKFTLGNYDYTQFAWKNDVNLPNDSYYMRGVAWMQITSKTNTSKKFVLANTHWSYGAEYNGTKLTNGTTVYQHYCKGLCKDETITKINSLKSANSGMPVFLTGDFNTSAGWFSSTGTYSTFSNACSLLSSKINATPGTGTYDHIFGAGTFTVKAFKYIDGINEIDALSDHPFAYSDVSF